MSLISNWFSSTLAFATDSQNTPEIDLLDSFEAVEIDIPTIQTAEVQIKGSNATDGTFDLIALEEPVPSSTGGFRTTVPLGGKYRYIKVYLSAAQGADRVFAVRGVSYASAGLVALIDRLKGVILAAGSAIIGRVGHDSTGIGHGVKTVSSAGAHEALVASSTPAKRVMLQAQTDNADGVAVGGDTVDATVATGDGILLYAGDWTPWVNVDDLTDIYVDALASGEGVRFIYET